MSQIDLVLPNRLTTGDTETFLPENVLDPIISSLSPINSHKFGGIIVPCSQASSSATLNFRFSGDSGPLITVSLSELLSPIVNANCSLPTFSNVESMCNLPMAPGDPRHYALGVVYLRSAYIVYDLIHNQIAIAQTDYDATYSNIQEV